MVTYRYCSTIFHFCNVHKSAFVVRFANENPFYIYRIGIYYRQDAFSPNACLNPLSVDTLDRSMHTCWLKSKKQSQFTFLSSHFKYLIICSYASRLYVSTNAKYNLYVLNILSNIFHMFCFLFSHELFLVFIK